MRIPKSFKLMGETIKVVWKEDLSNERDRSGEVHYRINEIWIQPSTNGRPRPQDAIEHTFFHELTHWVLYFAGDGQGPDKTCLGDNEHLVDLIAGLFHQALTTAEYEDEDRISLDLFSQMR